MTNNILYLSKADVESLCPSRSDLRSALRCGIMDTSEGRLKFEPKSTLVQATGHSFQSMPALVADEVGEGFASLKWVSVVPPVPDMTVDNIQSVICLNDLKTGKLLSIMDGNFITLVRTAALSALAAETMLTSRPQSIGFIGAGKQAVEHLLAFMDLYSSINEVRCFSRSYASAEKLKNFANTKGLKASATEDYEEVLKTCDIVISTVPSSPNFVPFLDARLLKSDAIAVMVDLGRSWIEDGFTAFDFIATDSLHQSQHPYDNEGRPLQSVAVQADLADMIKAPVEVQGRKAFFFKGIASADLVAARLVYERAVAEQRGQVLVA